MFSDDLPSCNENIEKALETLGLEGTRNFVSLSVVKELDGMVKELDGMRFLQTDALLTEEGSGKSVSACLRHILLFLCPLISRFLLIHDLAPLVP